MRNKVNFVWNIRDDYREGRRAGRGVLLRGGRTAQMIAQESVEEHIRGSVERLDNQFSTLHQDVATLSCEVLYTDPPFQPRYRDIKRNCFILGYFSILRDILALTLYNPNLSSCLKNNDTTL